MPERHTANRLDPVVVVFFYDSSLLLIFYSEFFLLHIIVVLRLGKMLIGYSTKRFCFFSNCLLSNPVLQMLSQILDLDILIPNYVCCQNAYVDFYFLFGVNSCYFSLKMHVICYSVPYAKKQTETCVQTTEWGSTYLLVNVSLLEFLLLLGHKLIQIFLIPLNLSLGFLQSNYLMYFA